MQCELDQKIWAVVSSREVVLNHVTYAQAVEYVNHDKICEKLDGVCSHLYIITSAAAARFTQKEKAA